MRIQAMDRDLRAATGQSGLIVVEVAADGPAARKGLRPGDVIVEIDGERLLEPRQLVAAVDRLGPDARPVLLVAREGRRFFVAVPLDGGDAAAERPPPPTPCPARPCPPR